MNVTNDPVDGRERENWLSVLPSSPIATATATTVSGAATPADATMPAKPKKKLVGAPTYSIGGRTLKRFRFPPI